MTQFFAKDYTGGAFELFGSAHLVALALVLLINLVIVASRKRFTDLGKKRFRFGLAALLVINELAFHLWNYSIGHLHEQLSTLPKQQNKPPFEAIKPT